MVSIAVVLCLEAFESVFVAVEEPVPMPLLVVVLVFVSSIAIVVVVVGIFDSGAINA